MIFDVNKLTQVHFSIFERVKISIIVYPTHVDASLISMHRAGASCMCKSDSRKIDMWRALLEAFKCLTAGELLTVAVLVSRAWKAAAYSNEMLLSLIDLEEEDTKSLSSPLYKRVKRTLQGTKYLLHIEAGKMLIWALRSKAQKPLKSQKFTHSSRYVLISPSQAIVTGGEGCETSCVRVNLKTREITELQSMRKARIWHGICVLQQRVYVSGGGLGNSTTAFAERYEKGEWTLIASMTIPRYNHTLCAYLKRVYAFGGTSGFYVASVEYYDGRDWVLASMVLPSPRNYSSVLPVKKGLLLVGGFEPRFPVKWVYLWEEAAQCWREVKKLEVDYSLSNAIALRSGVLYVYNYRPSKYQVALMLT